MITVSVDAALRQLTRYNEDAKRAVDKAVKKTTIKIHKDVVDLIKESPRGGETYRRGNVVHTASAAGEAPAKDRGDYLASLRFEFNGRKGFVYSRMPRSFWLEYGTLHVAARPHFAPTLEKNRDTLKNNIEEELRNLNNGGN